MQLSQKFFISKAANPQTHMIGQLKFVGEDLCRDFLELDLDLAQAEFEHALEKSHFSDFLLKKEEILPFLEHTWEIYQKKRVFCIFENF